MAVRFKDNDATGVLLDPFLETADTDLNNNAWPPRMVPTRFDVFKRGEWRGGRPNPMQEGQGGQSVPGSGR